MSELERSLEDTAQFIHRNAGLSQNGPQRTFCDLGVVGNDKSAKRCPALPQNDVAATLPINGIAEPTERLNKLATG
ncbi:MAG: hypothetical protein P9C36_13845 [Defluviicoccus sp.]|nr:hypothetical protein [Defluviicoccus sp.]MDG4593700.1 hypothetical protein [Defluviicoccus sp.]MDS4009856.1 hypothetical protein [Defluviicoccus sp.]MDS4074195.1 hypothetical protein [Defluviicoccus sp.]